MSLTLTLLSHGVTAATLAAAFPADEGIERDRPLADPGRADVVLRGPERRCAHTAAALGLSADRDDRLRDADYGRWRGRSLDEVAADEPDAVALWLTDPASAPHGGESVVDLVARVGGWLRERPLGVRRTVAVTHPAVVKAAIVSVLDAKPTAFWRIDVTPGSRTVLRGGPGRWTLRWLTSR
ncbi:MAG: histidine phosphatase family protein [Actinomycetota bacterium]|nr:histidine phosphatase family protein [Actinomycetota bacterium]